MIEAIALTSVGGKLGLLKTLKVFNVISLR